MLYDIAVHALKSACCLALFYLFFKLLLSRETFHALNRAVILAGMVVSLALPLCVITVEREIVMASVQGMPVPSPVGAVATPISCEVGPPWWQTALGVLFVAGAAASLMFTARSLLGVRRIIRRGRRIGRRGTAYVVATAEDVAPFSWWRTIVIPEHDLDEGAGMIITHETAHVRLHHTLDLLLADFLSALQWFNPAMWLLGRELRAIHEYEADAAVLRSGADGRDYQLLLIKKAVGGRWYSVANSLNHSKLKNRITMMLRKPSSRWAAARTLLLLPLAGAALGAFARTAYVVVPDDKVNQFSAIAQSADSTVTNVTVYNLAMSDDAAIPTDSMLILLNGRRITSEEMERIPSEGDMSVNVLKGDAAIGKYGQRGHHGVVEIYTGKLRQHSVGTTVGISSGTSERMSARIVVDTVAGGTQKVLEVNGMNFSQTRDGKTLYIINRREYPSWSMEELDRLDGVVSMKVNDVQTMKKYEGYDTVIEITTSAEGSGPDIEPVYSDVEFDADGRLQGDLPEVWLYVVDGRNSTREEVLALSEACAIYGLNVIHRPHVIDVKYGSRYRAGVAEITTKAAVAARN